MVDTNNINSNHHTNNNSHNLVNMVGNRVKKWDMVVNKVKKWYMANKVNIQITLVITSLVDHHINNLSLHISNHNHHTTSMIGNLHRDHHIDRSTNSPQDMVNMPANKTTPLSVKELYLVTILVRLLTSLPSDFMLHQVARVASSYSDLWLIYLIILITID